MFKWGAESFGRGNVQAPGDGSESDRPRHLAVGGEDVADEAAGVRGDHDIHLVHDARPGRQRFEEGRTSAAATPTDLPSFTTRLLKVTR